MSDNQVAPTMKTMNCALIQDHGEDIDKLLGMGQRPIPQRKEGELLLQVYAVALAPGDIRVMKAHCDFFQSPGVLPYIPGGDLCGVVVEADSTSKFHKGDEVVVMFEIPKPTNALAEYAVVKDSLAVVKPAEISWTDAVCLTSSAVTAYLAATQYVTNNNAKEEQGSLRIMILGASGGVGTFLVQLCNRRNNPKCSFLAATSTDEKLLKSLGVDRVIDYRNECWFDIPEFEDEPFDVIFDLGVGKKEAWIAAKNYSVLNRKSGKFITLSGHNPEMQVHNIWQAFGLTAVMFGRMLGSACSPLIPKYIWHCQLDKQPHETIQKLFQLVLENKIKVILDPISPLPFTAEGIRRGFHLMNSRHAHGKVVVQVLPYSSN